jgi:CRP/FNR family cyclic AMP-dependent transcriptional regulator
MKRKKIEPIDWEPILAGINHGEDALEYGADSAIFRQGDPADAVFYLRDGRVELTVASDQGKEVSVAVLGGGEFFGEGCLAGQPVRIATATARADTTVARIGKPLMVRLLHEQHAFSEMFAAQLLARNLHYEEELIGQLFNSSEKRLARILLLLAHYGKESRSETVTPKISQETMAQMVGITRSRVGHFLRKFRRLGFIDYGKNRGLTVHSGLLSVVLHDDDSAAGA